MSITNEQWRILVNEYGENAYKMVKFASMSNHTEQDFFYSDKNGKIIDDTKYVNCTSNESVENLLKDRFLSSLCSIKESAALPFDSRA